MAGALAGGISGRLVSRSSDTLTLTLVMRDPVVVAVSPSTGAEMLLVRGSPDEDREFGAGRRAGDVLDVGVGPVRWHGVERGGADDRFTGLRAAGP